MSRRTYMPFLVLMLSVGFTPSGDPPVEMDCESFQVVWDDAGNQFEKYQGEIIAVEDSKSYYEYGHNMWEAEEQYISVTQGFGETKCVAVFKFNAGDDPNETTALFDTILAQLEVCVGDDYKQYVIASGKWVHLFHETDFDNPQDRKHSSLTVFKTIDKEPYYVVINVRAPVIK